MTKANPLTGITDGKMRTRLRSALRKIWSQTIKKEFIKSVRYKKDGRYHVRCVECGVEMALADKATPTNKDGSLSKAGPQKLYDADHVDGVSPLGDPIRELGPHWQSLAEGELQILCKPCHQIKTQKHRESGGRGGAE